MKNVIIGLALLVVVVFVAACSGGAGAADTTGEPVPAYTEQEPESTPVQAQEPQEAPEPVTPQIPTGAIEWSEAGRHIGETATVYGNVRSVVYATNSNGQPTFVNIGADYPDQNRITAVIWDDYRGNFSPPPESQYRGRTVCVTGYLDTYEGAVQIEVTAPSQITVIE